MDRRFTKGATRLPRSGSVLWHAGPWARMAVNSALTPPPSSEERVKQRHAGSDHQPGA
jgi:hypothetical protein